MTRKQVHVQNADSENSKNINGCDESNTQVNLRNFAREVSIIGVRNLADSSMHGLNKAIWVALLLSGLLLAIYQIQDRVVDYLSYPVQTTIDIVQAQELKFPQITMCNENIVRRSVAKQYGLEQIFHDIFPPWPVGSWPKPNLTLLREFNKTPEEWEEIRVNLSQPHQRSVISCSWAEKSCNDSWFDSIPTNMGQCFAFNTARLNLSTVRPGAKYGVQIILLVDQHEYLVVSSPAAGFRVLIHDPEEIPLMKEAGFRVSPGFSTAVAISQERVNKIGPPHGDCLDTPGYFLSACFQKCEAVYVIARCQCKLWYMKGDAPICDILQIYTCTSEVLAEYVSDEEGLRKCHCPPQCHSNNYNYIISQGYVSEFFSDFGYQFIGDGNTSKDYVAKDFVLFEVFFTSAEYKEITMVPAYTLMPLLSDIGGALGLLLGATLLTVYEVIEFGIRFLHSGLRPRKPIASAKVIIPVDAL